MLICHVMFVISSLLNHEFKTMCRQLPKGYSLPLAFPADIISTVEFNHTGELLATGDKGGRVVIFQREPEVRRHAQPSSYHITIVRVVISKLCFPPANVIEIADAAVVSET